MAAAVADFRPAAASATKIKKDAAGGAPAIALVRNADLIAELGARRTGPRPVLVAFALETGTDVEVLAYAKSKLVQKKVDLIVANDVGAPGVGFEHDTNAVSIIEATGAREDVPLTDKRAIARAVLDAVLRHRSRETQQ